MSTRRLFTISAPAPASPYVYVQPRRRRWPVVGAFVVGALCVLALVGRPQFSGGAGAMEHLWAAAQPHWSVPADPNATAGVAKSDRLRPVATSASATNAASPAPSATQGEFEPASSAPNAATAAKASHRRGAHKSYRHERRTTVARRDAKQRYSDGAWGLGGFSAGRNATWFSGIN